MGSYLNVSYICSLHLVAQLQIYLTRLAGLLQHHFLLNQLMPQVSITLVSRFLLFPFNLQIHIILTNNLTVNLGALQGLHNIHGGFSIPNMSASLTSLTSRNAAMNGVPSSGVQQPGGNISNGRFTSNNMPVPIPQVLFHGNILN